MKVTREQLLIAGVSTKKADEYLKPINDFCDTFNINTPLRMAHFLAQVLHETGGLTHTKEIGSDSYFTKYETGKLGKTLGNYVKGDGAKYKGRGLIMITGRANYQTYQYSGFCRGNVMSKPELLEKPLGATKSGMWWWWKHGCNSLADIDNVVLLTKRINGGTNGLESRKKWLERTKKAFGL